MTEFKVAVAGETEGAYRQFLAYLFKQDSPGVASDGIITGLFVYQTTTASAAVQIGVGAAVTQDSLLNGAMPLLSNAIKTLDVLTANPMGATPRNDLVVFDAATASIRVIIGVPNAVPTDPSVPGTATVLARLRHAASATTVPAAKIDDTRVLAGFAGPNETFGGTPILGTYNPLKPIQHALARKVGTSDAANGLATATTIPLATAILSVTLGMQGAGHSIMTRTDVTTSTSVVFQTRSITAPGVAIPSVAYDFSHDIAYQV